MKGYIATLGMIVIGTATATSSIGKTSQPETLKEKVECVQSYVKEVYKANKKQPENGYYGMTLFFKESYTKKISPQSLKDTLGFSEKEAVKGTTRQVYIHFNKGSLLLTYTSPSKDVVAVEDTPPKADYGFKKGVGEWLKVAKKNAAGKRIDYKRFEFNNVPPSYVSDNFKLRPLNKQDVVMANSEYGLVLSDILTLLKKRHNGDFKVSKASCSYKPKKSSSSK